MPIYDFPRMGHDYFEFCKIVAHPLSAEARSWQELSILERGEWIKAAIRAEAAIEDRKGGRE